MRVIAAFAALALATVGGVDAGASPSPSPNEVTEPTVSAVHAQGHGQHRHARHKIFPGHILVAYYGTAQTGSMGVLGETAPPEMTRRLRAAAKPFGQTGKKVQIVYELIASVADAGPGDDGDYSHLIPKSYVRTYVRAAKRNHALLVLDLQPGRSTFLSQALHYRWALKKPWVGLALDPEWRMGPHQVPGRQIGSVGAAEVNRVSRMVSRLVHRERLPQKLFMLHQFRTDMIRDIGQVKRRAGLAMVQHVDGFGTREQKLATYHAVAKPRRFHMGFKLFYDEDVHRFKPRQVLHIKPRVQFVSFQ